MRFPPSDSNIANRLAAGIPRATKKMSTVASVSAKPVQARLLAIVDAFFAAERQEDGT